MGHQHLGRLPGSRKWRQVIDLISGGADVEDVAAATSKAAESQMIDASNDPAVQHAVWLLTQIPIAARQENFAAELRKLGLQVGNRPSLIEVVTAMTEAVDRHVARVGGRTDLGEMAQLSAAESLNAVAGRELPDLFGATPEKAQAALGGLGTVSQFAVLARDFFARLSRGSWAISLVANCRSTSVLIHDSVRFAIIGISRTPSIFIAMRHRGSSRNFPANGSPSIPTKVASTRPKPVVSRM